MFRFPRFALLSRSPLRSLLNLWQFIAPRPANSTRMWVGLTRWQGAIVRLPRRLSLFCLSGVFACGLVACSVPQVQAENRLFLDLSLELLDHYALGDRAALPPGFGGISAIAYDRQTGGYYALSDDRGMIAPARFYALQLEVNRETGKIAAVEIGDPVTLQTAAGEPFAPGTIDPEGLALSPDRTLMISSEGDTAAAIAPFIAEFNLDGTHRRDLPLYDYFLPSFLPSAVDASVNETAEETGDSASSAPTIGVQNNAGFEALTIGGRGTGEPYRVFAAIESPLIQDLPNLDQSPDPVIDPTASDTTSSDATSSDVTANSTTANPTTAYSRLIHYTVIGDDRIQIVAEHLYPIDPPPFLATTGLTELLALDQPGYFLSLERSYGTSGFNAKLFQVNIAGATDTATLAVLRGDLNGIQPVRKQLLLDFAEFASELPIDNLESLSFGPRLADGSPTLWVVSDDNFRDEQTTQFWLFRLLQARP